MTYHRSVQELEFLKYANSVHVENQSLINHIREQDEQITKLQGRIEELNHEIYEYEYDAFNEIFIEVTPTETTNLIPQQKKCCAIM